MYTIVTQQQVDDAIFEERSPSQANSFGCVKHLIDIDHLLYEPISEYIVRTEGYNLFSYPEEIVAYIYDCWDGYSEYTVLESWKEITLHWKYRSKEKMIHFTSFSELLKSIAEEGAL